MKSHFLDPVSFKEPAKAAAGMVGDVVRDLSISQGKQDGLQVPREGACECSLSPALGVWKSDRASLKVHQIHPESRLAQSASSVQSNHEGNAHPFRFIFKPCDAALNFFVGDLSFFFGGGFGNAELAKRVCFNHPALHGDLHDLAKKLHILQGGIAPARFVSGFSSLTPNHKLGTMPELNQSRMGEARDSEPMLNVLPAVDLALGGFGVGIVGLEPSIDPAPPQLLGRLRLPRLRKAGLGAEHLRLGRLNLGLNAESSRSRFPFATIFSSQEPIRASRSGVKRRHGVTVTL